ncbi:MAG TPA: cellulase family glycosylhydrolase, partial [Thermoanaerobaculia bacterium]
MPLKTTTTCLFALTFAACSRASAPVIPMPGEAAVAAAPTFDFPDTYRSAYVDSGGVIRWRDDATEVRLFGANYALPSSGDFRAAGYLTGDRYALVDQDMAHFARMGWNGLRVAFWGDWQNADIEGNLIENEHLDLVDYIIARARERGIYILFNPIHTYHAGWPDAMGDSFPGFAAHIEKAELGRDSAAIAAQVNYIRQILDHVNPYTGTRLADEPSILFIEMINEPTHHPADTAQQIEYIDALVQAVRDAGSDAITFHNVSQSFGIAPALVGSDVQGASFGWYPTGLNSG